MEASAFSSRLIGQGELVMTFQIHGGTTDYEDGPDSSPAATYTTKMQIYSLFLLL
jgi:hypothetical protein